MGRRFASYRLRRSSGGGGGSGGAAGLLLPASVVEYWHSEINCTASAWVGQVQGISLTGVNTPTVAADGANFNGRVVAQAAQAGAKIWRTTGLPTVLASGTRPWSFAVGRFRSTAASVTAVSYGRPAGSHDMSLQHTTGAPNRFNCFFLGGANPNTAPTPSDTNGHRFKGWMDGTNANLNVDDNNYALATAATLGGNVTALAVGANAADASAPGDVSIAFWLLCTAKPTATEEALIDAWAKSYWGVP